MKMIQEAINKTIQIQLLLKLNFCPTLYSLFVLCYSNTTLVKVKFYFTFGENLYIYYSNTTLVKVKSNIIRLRPPYAVIQIQLLLKLNSV